MSASVRWQVAPFDMGEQALAWLGEMMICV